MRLFIQSLLIAVIATTAIIADNPKLVSKDIKMPKYIKETGIFAMPRVRFPQDYYLIPHNLPFIINLLLHDEEKDILNLSKKQVTAIKKIENKSFYEIIKRAKKVRELEVELTNFIAFKEIDLKNPYDISQENKLLNEIKELRVELTKIHLKNITDAKNVLTKEQFEKFLSYAAKMDEEVEPDYVIKQAEQALGQKLITDNLKKRGMFYTGVERYPRDYFLTVGNLTFMPRFILNHPKSSALKLSQEQKKKIKQVRLNGLRVLFPIIKEVKKLETKLADDVAIKSKLIKDQDKLLENIARLRYKITNTLIKNLIKMRMALTKEQYEQFIVYAKERKF